MNMAAQTSPDLTMDSANSAEIQLRETSSDIGRDSYPRMDWTVVSCNNFERIFESHVFQMMIVALVTIDMAIVAVELTCSLDVIVQKDDSKRAEFIRKLQICNLVVISLFMLEILTKILVYRRRFLKCYEIVDTVVIVVSFVLDIIHIVHVTPTTAAEFIIVARLWRVARIVNGTVYQIRSTKEEKIEKLLKENKALKEEIKSLKLQSLERIITD